MIVLDTHIWIWWVLGDKKLPEPHSQSLSLHESTGLGVSAISCWEIAKAVQTGRLTLPIDVHDWLALALDYPGVTLIPIDVSVAVESTRLPGEFHRDPADQLIVATARVLNCPLVTLDAKILAYPHVQLL